MICFDVVDCVYLYLKCESKNMSIMYQLTKVKDIIQDAINMIRV